MNLANLESRPCSRWCECFFPGGQAAADRIDEIQGPITPRTFPSFGSPGIATLPLHRTRVRMVPVQHLRAPSCTLHMHLAVVCTDPPAAQVDFPCLSSFFFPFCCCPISPSVAFSLQAKKKKKKKKKMKMRYFFLPFAVSVVAPSSSQKPPCITTR